MKLAFLALSFVAGVAIAVQVAVNSQLRGRLHDPMHATLISFFVGGTISILYCLIVRSPLPDSSTLTTAPWWIWTGGALGILYVWSTVVVGPHVGIAMFLSLVIAGQMLTSLLIDHFGWLQMPAVPLSPLRLCGIVLVVVGATMVSWTK